MSEEINKFAKFLDDQFKFKEENEKLTKKITELEEDLKRANTIIETQSKTIGVINELRWSQNMKITEMESNNWSNKS